MVYSSKGLFLNDSSIKQKPFRLSPKGLGEFVKSDLTVNAEETVFRVNDVRGVGAGGGPGARRPWAQNAGGAFESPATSPGHGDLAIGHGDRGDLRSGCGRGVNFDVI